MKQVIESIRLDKNKWWFPRFCRRSVSDAVGKRKLEKQVEERDLNVFTKVMMKLAKKEIHIKIRSLEDQSELFLMLHLVSGHLPFLTFLHGERKEQIDGDEQGHHSP